jgi:hypothetical protein
VLSLPKRTIAGENKLGLYRQCFGARKGGGARQSMCADALPIQPVVLSRDRGMPAMGIESSGCRWRTMPMVVLPSCSVPSAVVGAGLAG